MCIINSSGVVDVTVTEADSMESPMTSVQQQEKAEVKVTSVKEEQKQVLLDKQSTEEDVKDIQEIVQEKELKETVKECSNNDDKVEGIIEEIRADKKEIEEVDDERMDQEAGHEATTAEDTDTTEAHPQETVYVIMISPGDITEGDTDVQDEYNEATLKEDDDSQEDIDVTTEYDITVQKETDVFQKSLESIIHVESNSSLKEHREECTEYKEENKIQQVADVSMDHNVTKSELGIAKDTLAVLQEGHIGTSAVLQEERISIPVVSLVSMPAVSQEEPVSMSAVSQGHTSTLAVSQVGHVSMPAVSQEGLNLVQEHDVTLNHDTPKSEQDVIREDDEAVVMLRSIHSIVQEPDILQQERCISKEQHYVFHEAWDVSHKELDVDNVLQKEQVVTQEPEVTQEPGPDVPKDITMEECNNIHTTQDTVDTEQECLQKESSNEGVGDVLMEGQGVLHEQQVAPKQHDSVQRESCGVHETEGSDLASQEERDFSLKQSIDTKAEYASLLEGYEKAAQQEQPRQQSDTQEEKQQQQQEQSVVLSLLSQEQQQELSVASIQQEQQQTVVPTPEEHSIMDQENCSTVDEHDVPRHEASHVQQEYVEKQDIVPNDQVVEQQETDSTEQKQFVVQEEQDVTQQRHNVTQQQHDMTQQQHDMTQQRHDVTQVTQQGHDVTQQGHIVTQQGHDVTQQGHDVTQQGHDVTQQGHDVTQQGHDVTQQGHDVTEQGHDVTQQGHDVTQQGYDVTWDEPVHGPDTEQHGHSNTTQEHVDTILKEQVSIQHDLEENRGDVTLKEPDVQNGYEAFEEDKTEVTHGGEGLAVDDNMDAMTSSQSETTESLGGSPQMQFDDDEEMETNDPQDPDWSMMEADKEDNCQSSCESTEGPEEDSDTMVSSQITVVEDTETDEQGTTQHSVISSSSAVLTQEQEVALATSTSEKENVTECRPDKHSSQATADSSEVNIDESCEAEGREMIDSGEELERQQKSSLLKLASDLLEQWSDLKEVYRIPKRSSPPVSSRTVSL